MDWDLVSEAVRNGMRSASLFVWAFFGVMICWLLWPYSAAVLAVLVPYGLARAWKAFRSQGDPSVSKFPPLSREDWRVARSKLRKGKV